ncbi:hypothetical protein NVV95_02730 [Herbiconiux sp. CPCC 205716]|uniref:Uncharacterized protein n=1 Tax=Herbiconiux gentiana TaxID=2970912 RepID=A0ABT2GBB2_9MICO|nr:hypothetical protein [Herbiconiux gentiana]MCS5713465.1 hypothetical protein [Herbiconiux gentiana]
MTEHHDGSGEQHEGVSSDDHVSSGSSDAKDSAKANGAEGHEPASPGGSADTGPDPYDIESDLGPDGVPATEPEADAE